MNREIKFRAWDIINQEMLKPYDVNGNAKDLAWFFSQYHESECSGNNMMLMQYTGLKDRNGKEIYEGDILRLEDIVCPVTWNDGSFQMITSQNQGKSPAIQDRVKAFEVIGNIYENPELIKP